MAIAVCNYIRFKSSTGQYVDGYNFQNFFVGQTKERDGVSFLFAPFGVTPGAGTKGGDRSDSAVVAPATPIVINLFTEATFNEWLCEIKMVLLDPETYEEQIQVTNETWKCSRPEINVERAVLRLASPLDAVDRQVPRRTLSSVLVGSLPSTGTLSVS